MKKRELINILKNSFAPAYYVNREREIEIWNHEAEILTGYSQSEVKGNYCYDNILQHITKDGVNLCLNGCPLQKTIDDGQEREAEVFLHHKEGQRIPVKVRTLPVKNGNEDIIGAVEFFISNKKRKSFEEKIRSLKKENFTDDLTGISNRKHLQKILKDLIAEKTAAENKIAFCFIDIDDFKDINDNYGHLIGDKALKMLSNTLQSNLRPSDKVFRWGGDEFAMIIFDLENREELLNVLQRLRMIVNNSYFTVENDEEISITTSWGASFLKKEDSSENLIKRTDSLMYESKKTGKNRITTA